MSLANASQLVISGKVNESDILRISEDMPAEIKTSATGEKVISGKVKRIERIISSDEKDPSEGYTVEVSIDEEDSELLIGMSASVKIILDRCNDALSVPYDAVIGGDNDGYYVFIATSTSKGEYVISKRKITKGFDGDYYLEVTSDNLNENDIVLTNPRGISDGDTLSLKLPEE
jgi:HlyD family secretion protein